VVLPEGRFIAAMTVRAMHAIVKPNSSAAFLRHLIIYDFPVAIE
jgi:hypothetical protein